MREFLSSPNAEGVLSVLAGLVFLVLLCLTFLAIWLSRQWRLHRRAELEAVLKKEMLDRGMSAAEIERVLAAPLASGASPAPPGPEAVRPDSMKRG